MHFSFIANNSIVSGSRVLFHQHLAILNLFNDKYSLIRYIESGSSQCDNKEVYLEST